LLNHSIAGRLAVAIGLDPSCLEENRAQSIVEGRCRRLGLPDAALYGRYLDSEPAELDALIDEVVVKETRFFRDIVVFKHIRSDIPRLAEQFPGPLGILSAPCGTGQEAYSIAAVLRQAGLPLSRFTIDAFDISIGALSVARRGVYAEQSLRHLPAEVREHCGRADGGVWKIDDGLRERVNFERRNLAQAGALGGGPSYHLILCRNLFIYLHSHARRTLAKSLASALIPGGRLVIGTADRVEELAAEFSAVRPPSSFALMHKVATGESAMVPLRKLQPPISARSGQPVPAVPVAMSPISFIGIPASSSGAAELYQSAIHHKEHGNLRKAERRCRQALYLEPGFLPALELLQQFWLEHPRRRLHLALSERIVRARAAAANAPQGTQANLEAERNAQ
jgi:chemotaxis protein methyltransferase WspC